MFIDAYNRYSNAQALTADAASTNSIDHGIQRNIGDGEAMAVVITVSVAAAGGGTLQINLQDSADDSSYATIASTLAIAAASLGAGAKHVLPIPPHIAVRRYTRLQYDLTTMTGITLSAHLAPQKMVGTTGENRFYADAITVS